MVRQTKVPEREAAMLQAVYHRVPAYAKAYVCIAKQLDLATGLGQEGKG